MILLLLLLFVLEPVNNEILVIADKVVVKALGLEVVAEVLPPERVEGV